MLDTIAFFSAFRIVPRVDGAGEVVGNAPDALELAEEFVMDIDRAVDVGVDGDGLDGQIDARFNKIDGANGFSLGSVCDVDEIDMDAVDIESND